MVGASHSEPQIQRHDFFVDGDTGVRLFVRELVIPTGVGSSAGGPILLLHGARVPGLASFDLPVPGGSFAADLAQLGFDVYVMDVRGFGRSTRPKEMDEPPGLHAPLVRSSLAAHDISAVVDAIRKRRGVARVALLGWATGGQWAGYYASLYPEKVSTLILLNSLYRGNSAQALMGRGTDSEDPAHPGHFNQASCGAYRLNDAASLLRPWDHSIPMQDKSEWRDPAVAKAYVDAALASDPTAQARNPPGFRSPCGAMEDSFYLATGRQLWDASLITAPTLILASERDFWSRAEDRENLAADLVHARRVQVIVIPGATHFVHLDRPDRGRALLLNSIKTFMAR
ncbi:alpha/beta fold hydrolase [Dyella silvatica]|uniref:alpha/beta fold hydrolase n=1 Tax=Dyella silvatica TaxID=2992128 RepID=UPI0022554CC1|nr:alpha/beta hydrolase [Dyella silvatica]